MSKQDHAKIIMPPPLLLLLTAASGLAFHILHSQLKIYDNIFINIFGGLLLLSGVGLIKKTITIMMAADTAVNPYKTSTSIVKEGPFKKMRNPIYVGLLINYIGIGCMANSLWILVLFPLFFLLLHFGVVLREENYLAEVFGEEYLIYKKQVKRWGVF